METDGPLKLLFRRYARDLLPLTGDEGATVHRAGPVEIQALKRLVDCVLELERDGEIYYRHIEFQAGADPEMSARCFRYNTQLVLQYGAPVLTTVIYLFPPRPAHESVFRLFLGGREINRWVFEDVCLWELDARESLKQGSPGLLALVPLMRGGADLEVLRDATKRIESAFPGERLPDAEDVLLALAGRYYTIGELARIAGRDRVIQSSLYQEALIEGMAKGRAEGEAKGEAKGRAEGEAKGEAKGRLEAERELCSALARKYHPAVADRALLVIASCSDPARLQAWALVATDLNDSEFLRLLGAD